MAIGPIGNTIYVNQQMATVASEQTAMQNKFDLQAAAAMVATQEKEKEVGEIRPTEENQEVDADREHTKEQAKQENERKNRSSSDENTSIHILDVKV